MTLEQWREKDRKDTDYLRNELAKEYGLEQNAKFKKLWAHAWDLGHSSGLREVEGIFRELVDLILPE